MKEIQILKEIDLRLKGLTKKNLTMKLSKIFNEKESVIGQTLSQLENKGEIIFNKGKIFSTKSLGYKIGKISNTLKSYAFCIIENQDNDVFIAPNNMNDALHDDTVLIMLKRNKFNGKEEGVVLKVLKHNIDKIVGTLSFKNKNAVVEPDNKRYNFLVNISLNKVGNAKDGNKVYVKVNSIQNKKVSGEIVEILGNASGEVNTDVLSIIRSYNLIEEFSEELLNQVKSVPVKIDAKKYLKRTDLRNELIFTIDGDDSKDFDDAVSLKEENGIFTLGVHIADVGEYVTYGSLLDKEAFKRGTSVYFPNMVLPMLPKELSDGICSLNPHEDRLTLSVEMKIDSTGNVLNYKIFESIINSKERMTYNNVTKILREDKEQNEKYAHLKSTLLLMQKLTLILENVRKERGSIDFDIPEPKIVLNPKTLEIEKLIERPRTISERIIESFMILANETVAQHFNKLKLPFVFRIHEAPDDLKLQAFNDFMATFGKYINTKKRVQPKDIQHFMEQFSDHNLKDVINSMLLRSMQKAKYSPICLGHFGLASKFYCHFTSPIRRYPDLTIHRIIKEQLSGRLNAAKINRLKFFVADASKQSSETEVMAEKAERDVDDYFKARYMQNKIGEEFDGIVSGVTAFGLFVKLNNTIEGFVSVQNLPYGDYQFDEMRFVLYNKIVSYSLGKKLKIKVAAVNLADRKIDFMLTKN